MDIGELVGVFTVNAATDNIEDGDCPEKTKDPGWKARINNWGSDGTKCSGTELYKFMVKKKNIDSPGYLRGLKPFVAKPGVVGYKWNLEICNEDHFPVQAHHLIPKNHLPDHGVCAFLAKGYTENENYQLLFDTEYNTDHAFNGYCMPYATPLAEWKKAGQDNDKKIALVGKLMKKTRRQLHQGSHKAAQYTDPVLAEEEDNIHERDELGYLDRVDDLLDVVMDAALHHANTCKKCENEKKKMPPRERVVQHVDQVSGIVKLLVDANRIFVSEASFRYFYSDACDLAKPNWLR